MNNVTFSPVSQSVQNINNTTVNRTTPFEAQKDFASVLKDSINKVNETQIESDKLTEKLARGENVDLHQVMIASQKASVTMTATLEIRNKVIEAYQEMMRMQV
ncbi:flagellar hook-basal body complex protein FliE [Cytobacillus gottheilii]|uniref:Flagellar hook-basal body complex protein FliE n=2 Tax=Bacillaceae TaxID=186817 RepID=A0A7V7RPX6_9BACI|nr:MULTISPECIES: flagellar hook-basal body complex protein FliE [Bacillaceae]KAB2335416.1 flagellar hook-basal body complex protein FliE [Bacillus mesophilum]QVY63286.1 flagellar hook-basal body complex protein FliE [Cytobacillus gottheilii]